MCDLAMPSRFRRLMLSLRLIGAMLPALAVSADMVGAAASPSFQELAVAGLERSSALAAADFDGDGGIDLAIVGEERGRPSALLLGWGSGRFERELARVSLPESCDLAAAGDFDADGDADLAVAALGGEAIHWFRGGSGGLEPAGSIALDGRITAWLAGEVNRRDGLADIVVATDDELGAQLQVFEHPEGALAGPPERTSLPAAAGSLAVGRLDGDAYRDIAVAAGGRTLLVPGRDRRLSLGAQFSAAVPAPSLRDLDLPFEVASLAVADFAGDSRLELALLDRDGEVHLLGFGGAAEPLRSAEVSFDRVGRFGPAWVSAGTRLYAARLSPGGRASLLALAPGGGEIARLDGGGRGLGRAAFDLLPLRLDRDAFDDLAVAGPDGVTLLLGDPVATYTVNSTGDASDEDTGDGLCDTGGLVGGDPECTLRAAIQQANATAGADAVEFAIAGSPPHTIAPASALPAITEALAIDGGTQPGFSGPPPIEISGAAAGLGVDGLVITGGDSYLAELAVHGFQATEDWFSGGTGILITTAGNVAVEGCHIGLASDGVTVSGNTREGIRIEGTSDNQIGGSHPSSRNVVSGNGLFEFLAGAGIVIAGTTAERNAVQGNYVGTDATGALDRGNVWGILVEGGADHEVGGTGAGDGNVVSGNERDGMQVGHIVTPPSAVLVQGNRVGTDATGAAPLGNLDFGIYVAASDSTIGGTTSAARNLASANGDTVFDHGIVVDGTSTTGVLVQGNYVGTDATGTLDLGNAGDGIYMRAADGNAIGGTAAGAGNVSSGNVRYGILLPSGTGGLVLGNVVGTSADGLLPLGNSIGIRVDAPNSQIGGSDPGAGNRIANSGGIFSTNKDGIFIGGSATTGIRMSRNSIYGNGTLAIEIPVGFPVVTYGPNPNDADDLDGGTNLQQNHPTISSAAADGTLVGALDSTPSTQFTLEFFSNRVCDASGYGEAEEFVGELVVVTDGNGDAPFNFQLPAPLAGGRYVTATATDPAGNTSELSPCRLVPPSADLAISKSNGVEALTPTQSVTYTIVAGNAGPDDAPATQVTDAPPVQLSGCSWTCAGSGGASCPASGSGGISQAIYLPAGGSATYALTCQVNTLTGPVTNSASVAIVAGGNDPNPDDNAASDSDAVRELDFGDAAEPGFPTLLASSGAMHGVEVGVFLGATVDVEGNGVPSALADGDDLAGSDDEDGVSFHVMPSVGRTAVARVMASQAGAVAAWIDFDGDGSWNPVDERILEDAAVVAGDNLLPFPVPAGAVDGIATARFRYASSASGLPSLPTGAAIDGEVEDHRVRIALFQDDFETGDILLWDAP